MIRFDDVHKTYKSGVDALRGINFEIEDGEFVFIIGKSGSGKSTLMKCITCEELPSEGTVSIDDFDISHMSRALVPILRRQIGMIYQDFRLIESKTVAENVSFAGEIIGLPKKSLTQTVQLVLNIVGLKDKADAYPQELSGGEQQRVAIARAMVNNPRIIVADEPTGNLDPETSENIMALLLDINRSGSTVIVCTHDSNLVDRMKKRVIEIEDGLIVRDAEQSRYSAPTTEDTNVEFGGYGIEHTGVAFGDDPVFEGDRDYSDNYDDEGFTPPPAPAALFFGETPPEALIEAEQAAAAAAAAAAAEQLATTEAHEAVTEAAADVLEETIKEGPVIEETVPEEPVPEEDNSVIDQLRDADPYETPEETSVAGTIAQIFADHDETAETVEAAEDAEMTAEAEVPEEVTEETAEASAEDASGDPEEESEEGPDEVSSQAPEDTADDEYSDDDYAEEEETADDMEENGEEEEEEFEDGSDSVEITLEDIDLDIQEDDD